MPRIGRAVGAATIVIGWSALAGCEPPAATPREGEPPPGCAGPEGASCPIGQLCVDMPEDGCDPEAGWIDCDGICVSGQCAGILALPCAGELVCVDDPDDDCDPEGDGADCPGICVAPTGRARPEGSTGASDACEVEGRVYVGTTWLVCARVEFGCAAPLVPFADACGCGCEPV